MKIGKVKKKPPEHEQHRKRNAIVFQDSCPYFQVPLHNHYKMNSIVEHPIQEK